MASFVTKLCPSRSLNAVRLGMCRFASASADSSSSKSLTATLKPGEIQQTKTHTGVVWDKDDYRLARFVGANREVNPNFAIDLVNKIPPKKVKARNVWCDGGDDKLGHPKVFINLDKPGPHTCGYCGLRFVKDEDHH